MRDGERRAGPSLTGTRATLADLVALRAVRLAQREPRAVRGSSGGARLTRLRGRGIDFAEVRQYQPGDDVRSIDWRVTARKARVHTKVYREERERPTLVVVDLRRAMRFGSRVRLKSVAASEIAALLAWHAVDAGDRVGGLVLDDRGISLIRPRRSPRTVIRLLGLVARANAALVAEDRTVDSPSPDAPGLGALLERTRHAARTGFRIYLVSDFSGLDATARRRLQELGRHNSVVAVDVFDALEAELPLPDRYTVSDGERQIQVDAVDARARTTYAQRFATRREHLEQACRAARADLVSIATHESVAHRLSERVLH
jgi:uncharacterized protein (DUF58 family)